MDGYEVKRVMDQIHISEKMQEDIIMNIGRRLEQENKRAKTGNLRRIATAAAAFALAVGIVGFPVHALVTSVVRERMESVPEEEMRGLNDMVQSQPVAADGFSREYSDSEKKRFKELWQEYENGTFPEGAITQVDNAADAPEGTLCYIRANSVFNLPAQEMTDEEMLQIIDFQHKADYAVTNSGVVTEEEKAAYRAEEARLEKIVQDESGISVEEAVEIAKKQLMYDLGDKADELELLTYSDGSAGVCLLDASDYSEAAFVSESEAGVIYDVGFGNPDTHATYGYFIDAVDGDILYTYK